MANFKDKIEDISHGSSRISDGRVLTGIVIQANERTNRCTIQYEDRNGTIDVSDNAYVNISIPGFIGWFPSKGDIVVFTKYLNYIEIQGLATYQNLDIRSKSNTPNDIYTNLFNYTIGGTIF